MSMLNVAVGGCGGIGRVHLARWAGVSGARIATGFCLFFVFFVSSCLAGRSNSQPQTIMVPMRDGTRLATDIYVPEGEGKYTAILARTPYDKAGAAGIAREAVKRGYAFVAQDTRGRFHSEGANLPFDADGWAGGRLDGFDTIEWIAKQSWSNGKIGTWGGSALGITQLLMAGTNPPHLASQYIVVGTPSFYAQAAYPGGIWKKAMIEDWLKATNHSLEAVKIWSSHPVYDAYWKERDLATRWSSANVPAIHIGGWYDIFTQGTIDSFAGYRHKGGAGARGKQRLVIGPWTHGVGNPKAGDLKYPDNAKSPPDDAMDAWKWFDSTLVRGSSKSVADNLNTQHSIPNTPAAVYYYVMGDTTDPKAPGNEWRTADDWPIPAKTTAFYLHGDHSLSSKPPAGGENAIHYTYDPKDPTPTVGGPQLTLPAGPKNQSGLLSRPDVVAFTTDVLDHPMEITGRVTLDLWASSDCPDTDFMAKLCDVYPDGTTYNVCEGLLRARFRNGFSREEKLVPGKPCRFKIDLTSTSIIFNKGHRLRLIISSASSPGFDPNPNTGDAFRADANVRKARNTLLTDRAHATRLLLPIIEHR